MDGIGKAQHAAMSGLERAGELMNQSASRVAHVSVGSSSAAKVSISSEARSLAQAADSATQDSFEEPLVGATMAKNMNRANLKVLQASDEMLAQASKIKR